MRYWIYCEPAGEKTTEPCWTILSDKAVLDTYWDYWCERMRQKNLEHLIDRDRCIEDWVTIHWAVEATPQSLLRIIGE